ncbi:hypothetical protein CSW58_05785 [Caulobacter sp. B11]|uniref:DUF1365 domain-containing protein n=1 Tax=Caulobacter sp. B11 TaxID=2048899 RepID=UPI000C12BD20|nr:DUF1365 family protein [Caulobacter sp. B11]PHY13434.1 hypothetical protein CSW58_05785 [Caulobacter sp. B11]
MRSGLYSGVVVHGRTRPRRHRLSYRIFMLALDLDEIDGLAARLSLFSHNRWNLVSLWDRDFAGRVRAPIRPQIEAKLAEAGFDLAGGAITLLCMPRLLGHGFNPLSVYFCHDRDGRLAATVHAVRNTFGEKHDYVLAVEPSSPDAHVRQACGKSFHVSPFMPMDLDYQFDLLPPGERVSIGVSVLDDEGLLLAASFAGQRADLTDKALLRAVLGHPWQLAGVLAAIHWEAVKLVLKGFRLFPNPGPPALGSPAK